MRKCFTGSLGNRRKIQGRHKSIIGCRQAIITLEIINGMRLMSGADSFLFNNHLKARPRLGVVLE